MSFLDYLAWGIVFLVLGGLVSSLLGFLLFLCWTQCGWWGSAFILVLAALAWSFEHIRRM